MWTQGKSSKKHHLHHPKEGEKHHYHHQNDEKNKDHHHHHLAPQDRVDPTSNYLCMNMMTIIMRMNIIMVVKKMS
jgi:ABC-type Zn2+ transport system substrate-binding protein/surface adhesin